MIDNATKRLSHLLSFIPQQLSEIDETSFSFKPDANKWSKKEIVGHLIDSAANNHHRFVRTQFEDNPAISYDQNKWNQFGFYQQMDVHMLVHFWTAYNQQLLALMTKIPEDSLSRTCIAGGQLATLDFLINDYVDHLEHHLRQLIAY